MAFGRIPVGECMRDWQQEGVLPSSSPAAPKQLPNCPQSASTQHPSSTQAAFKRRLGSTKPAPEQHL
eukprot:11164077-Lingulodinium_polyedra.AAC.1